MQRPAIGEEHVAAAVAYHTCFEVAAVLSLGAVETSPFGPLRNDAAGGSEFRRAIAMQKSTRRRFHVLPAASGQQRRRGARQPREAEGNVGLLGEEPRPARQRPTGEQRLNPCSRERGGA